MHIEVKHPCIEHKLAEVRSNDQPISKFRELISEITMLLSYRALEDLEQKEVEIETPIAKTICKKIKGEIIIVPILRAGLGMLDGVLSVMPSSKVGFLGMFRNEETSLPESYYENIPRGSQDDVHLIVDPMLATGGSTIAAIDLLKEKNIKKIIVVCIVTCPEGIEAVEKTHPDVKIYTASIDSHLNEKNYIVPGLGDAGDRLFGTY
jgi:uracil phosphoribosyltransferase